MRGKTIDIDTFKDDLRTIAGELRVPSEHVDFFIRQVEDHISGTEGLWSDAYSFIDGLLTPFPYSAFHPVN